MTSARTIALVAALIALVTSRSVIVSAAPADQSVFNYHLQHPGGDSGPGDPNAVFCLVEDISCPNFFPIGSKWMLLCISHQLGCRYFLGSWDEQREQFIPEKHVRMNWRRHGVPWKQTWTGSDVFAPESVLTPDGRRVMWAWLGGLHPSLSSKTIQSLPRELSLPKDGILRIKPLRELENLREDHQRIAAVEIPESPDVWTGRTVAKRILNLPGKSVEMIIRVPRDAALKRRWGLTLFADGEGGGLPLAFRPENGTIELGDTTAPFSVADLPDAEDVALRIFIDECIVEVFVNERQALVAAWFAKEGQDGLEVWSLGKSFPIGPVDIWKLKPANRGFLAARESGNWQPQTADAGPANAREDQPGQQP